MLADLHQWPSEVVDRMTIPLVEMYLEKGHRHRGSRSTVGIPYTQWRAQHPTNPEQK